MKTPLSSAPARRRGFSLMELLAVMAIMALLTTLGVTSYFGAVRSMTRRSAVKHYANTLVLARQRACMENSRVSVVIFNEVTGVNAADPNYVTPSYVVCKEVGRVSFVKGNNQIADEFTEIEKIFGTQAYDDSYRGSIRLYNITQGKWSEVYPWVEPFGLTGRRSASGNPYMTNAEKTGGYSLSAFAFRVNPNVKNLNAAQWEIGDAYGIEVAPVGTLPRNFLFEELQTSVSKAVTITFNPDGTAEFRPSGTVRITETQPPKKRSTISVAANGSIKYDEKWH